MDGRSLAPGVTHLSLVPTQLHRIFQTGHETALHGVKAILLGGASAPDALVDMAVEKGLPIHLSYGLTEMGSQVTTTPQGADRATLRTAGTVLPYRELRLADDGEILVRGHTLFAGYLRDGHVELPLDEDGWFHTRDLGRLNGEGQLLVIGRRDNQFISGGENVQPEEVERALLRLEGVMEAVVVPVADEEFGHRPLAFVRTKDSPPDADRMRRQLRDWLPGYMIPIRIESWPGGQEEVLKPSRSALATYAQSLRR